MLIRKPRRSGRPSLIGTAARTAVIAGTATAVSGNVAQRQQAQATQSQQAAAYRQQAQADQAVEVPAGPAPSSGDIISQLERLAALKSQGILTEQEFQTQKARILGS